MGIHTAFHAPVVKLVDTQDSGSCAGNGVMVRLHSGAPLFDDEECLGNGHSQKALAFARRGLEKKPDDEKLLLLKADAEQDLKEDSLKRERP